MLSFTDADMIQGFWEAYAISPFISTLDFLLDLISFRIAKRRLDFPLPISPITMVNFYLEIVVFMSLSTCTYLDASAEGSEGASSSICSAENVYI